MELVFEAQSIDYLRRIFSGSAAQELTQELIVPDSYPDCGRIVFTGACAVMRGKECRDGGAAVTGGVRAGLLYVPEDGSEARALECYLPYSVRYDHPAATAQTQLFAMCRVRAADARLINSRKILVRVSVVCDLAGFEETGETIRTLKDAPQALQTKTADYRCVLPREYAEKPFSMTEDLELSGGEPETAKLVQYWLTPEITEQKLTGNKAVFKGVLVFKALLLGADGTPQVMSRQLPLSQYCELRGDYADDELQVQICVTGSEAELVHMEDEPAKILLSANLLCQCVAMQGYDLTLTEDAYATRGDFFACVERGSSSVFARPAVARRYAARERPQAGARGSRQHALLRQRLAAEKRRRHSAERTGNSEHSLHGRGRRAPVGNCARPGFLHGSGRRRHNMPGKRTAGQRRLCSAVRRRNRRAL